MKTKIVTDSHSSVNPKVAKKLGIEVLPMPFCIDGLEYFEGITVTRKKFFEQLEAGAQVSTSQPSPIQVMKLWDRVLQTADELVYLPISSGLSGACATASAIALAPEYAGRVHVVDNGRIAMPQYRTVLDAVELAEAGYAGWQIKSILERTKDDFSIYISLDTLEYLKRGGRISATTAVVGSMLNIRPVLSLGGGLLESKKNVRGMKKAKRASLDLLQEDVQGRFAAQAEAGALRFLAAGTADPKTTKEWIGEIRANFGGAAVHYAPLSLGISCHTGEGALGCGCVCIPDEVLEVERERKPLHIVRLINKLRA